MAANHTIQAVFSLPTPPEFPASGLTLPGGVPTFAIPNTVNGKTYTLEYRDDLATGAWIPLTGSGTGTGDGGTIILKDESGSLPPQRFYRLGIQ